MMIEWQNSFNPRHDGWYGPGFVNNYSVFGAAGAAPITGTFINRLLVLGVG